MPDRKLGRRDIFKAASVSALAATALALAGSKTQCRSRMRGRVLTIGSSLVSASIAAVIAHR